MREEELQAVLKKAKTDASFFNQLFSEPEKALASAGFPPDLTKAAPLDCSTLTCGWSCQYTGGVAAESKEGCGLTCEWSCGWTAGVNGEQQKADGYLKAQNCEVTCSYTVHATNEVQEETHGKFNPDACTITCSDTCGMTCAVTQMMRD
jgi:hypothetical protein